MTAAKAELPSYPRARVETKFGVLQATLENADRVMLRGHQEVFRVRYEVRAMFAADEGPWALVALSGDGYGEGRARHYSLSRAAHNALEREITEAFLSWVFAEDPERFREAGLVYAERQRYRVQLQMDQIDQEIEDLRLRRSVLEAEYASYPTSPDQVVLRV